MHRSLSFALPLALAFVAGAAFSPLAQRLLPSAQAQTAAPPALVTRIIQLKYASPTNIVLAIQIPDGLLSWSARR